MSKTKMARAASLIMIITVISKGIGFLRDMLVASSFGATYQTDAYNMAITIPEILFAIFSLAITTTFIPILSDTYKNKGKEDMFHFSNNIMNILIVITLGLSVLGWVFSPQLVSFIAPKFTGKTYDLTVVLIKISVINLVFMAINGAYTAVLQTLDDFTSPALVGIIMNLPIIIYILIGAKGGVIGLTIATVMGNFLKVLIQLPWLFKHGYKYELYIDYKDSRIRKLLMLIAPVIIGAGANQLNAIINTNMGSGLPQGSISALNYSGRITDVVIVTFAASIVTVVYPALAREGSAKNYDQFRIYISKAVNNITLIMMPCTVGLIILSIPTITILLKHGVFDDNAVRMTSIALIAYSVGIPFYGVRDVFNRGLYALKDTKTSTINGLIGIGINISLNLILVPVLGLGGLALSTSIAAIACAFLLANSLRKKIGNINGKEIIKTTSKIIVASAVMGIAVYFSYYLLINAIGGGTGLIIGYISSILVGIAVYFLMLLVLKVEELNVVLGHITSKLKR